MGKKKPIIINRGNRRAEIKYLELVALSEQYVHIKRYYMMMNNPESSERRRLYGQRMLHRYLDLEPDSFEIRQPTTLDEDYPIDYGPRDK